MQRVTVINNSNSPQMLEDGTPIGAAYTPEARREGVSLTERDRKRLVEPGVLTVLESQQETPTPLAVETAPSVAESRPARRDR
jgi:hypothetical protein